jgi:hypothetical protein
LAGLPDVEDKPTFERSEPAAPHRLPLRAKVMELD